MTVGLQAAGLMLLSGDHGSIMPRRAYISRLQAVMAAVLYSCMSGLCRGSMGVEDVPVANGAPTDEGPAPVPVGLAGIVTLIRSADLLSRAIRVGTVHITL